MASQCSDRLERLPVLWSGEMRLGESREARPDARVQRPLAVDRACIAAATAVARDQVSQGRSHRIHPYLAVSQLVADVYVVRNYAAGKSAGRIRRRIDWRISSPAPVGSR